MTQAGHVLCQSVCREKKNRQNDTSSMMALTLFCEKLLTSTFSWPAMTSYLTTSYDLFGGHRLPVALDACHTALESSLITRFITDVEKQVEIFTPENICINRVVTWPWEQGESSTTKGHRNVPLADLVQKDLKVSYAKTQTSIRKL